MVFPYTCKLNSLHSARKKRAVIPNPRAGFYRTEYTGIIIWNFFDIIILAVSYIYGQNGDQTFRCGKYRRTTDWLWERVALPQESLATLQFRGGNFSHLNFRGGQFGRIKSRRMKSRLTRLRLTQQSCGKTPRS